MIQYEIGKHIQKHEKLHKDTSDITIALFIAANPKLYKKSGIVFHIKFAGIANFSSRIYIYVTEY